MQHQEIPGDDYRLSPTYLTASGREEEYTNHSYWNIYYELRCISTIFIKYYTIIEQMNL